MFANAESYEGFMGRWSRLVASRFVDFIDLPDGGQLLDVGSGTGSLAFAIAQVKAKSTIVGVDASKEYVAYANSRNPRPDRISFEVGDAGQLRFADATFRASLSLLVFNFFPDPLKALRELYPVTESRGLIAAAVWDYGGEMLMLRAFWDAASSVDAAAEKRHEGYMPLCRSGELSQLMEGGRPGKRSGEAAGYHNAIRVVRRLLEPIPPRARPGRHLRRNAQSGRLARVAR